MCKHFRNESFENVVYLNNYCFIQYAVSKRNLYQGKLLEYLRENEFCYTSNPRIDFDFFTKIMLERWNILAQSIRQGQINIFDGDFFQHPIEDIMRSFTTDKRTIIRYFSSVGSCIKDLNPIIFYITQRNEAESLARIAAERGRDIFLNPEMIAHWKQRKGIELDTIRELPLSSCIIDNSDYNWNRVFEIITEVIERNLQEPNTNERGIS